MGLGNRNLKIYTLFEQNSDPVADGWNHLENGGGTPGVGSAWWDLIKDGGVIGKDMHH